MVDGPFPGAGPSSMGRASARRCAASSLGQLLGALRPISPAGLSAIKAGTQLCNVCRPPARSKPKRPPAAAAAIVRSQRQKQAVLASVPARPSQSLKIVGSKILATGHGSAQGKRSWFAPSHHSCRAAKTPCGLVTVDWDREEPRRAFESLRNWTFAKPPPRRDRTARPMTSDARHSVWVAVPAVDVFGRYVRSAWWRTPTGQAVPTERTVGSRPIYPEPSGSVASLRQKRLTLPFVMRAGPRRDPGASWRGVQRPVPYA